jgi:hypothetical protein
VRTNECATLNDWLDTLRNDTRHAAAATLTRAAEEDSLKKIELTSARDRVTYELLNGQIVRTVQRVGEPATTRIWKSPFLRVDVTSSPSTEGPLLHLTAWWRPASGCRTETPAWRFETTFLVGRSYTR